MPWRSWESSDCVVFLLFFFWFKNQSCFTILAQLNRLAHAHVRHRLPLRVMIFFSIIMLAAQAEIQLIKKGASLEVAQTAQTANINTKFCKIHLDSIFSMRKKQTHIETVLYFFFIKPRKLSDRFAVWWRCNGIHKGILCHTETWKKSKCNTINSCIIRHLKSAIQNKWFYEQQMNEQRNTQSNKNLT